MAKPLTDAQLLAEILDEHGDTIPERTFEAFAEWRVLALPLKPKQKRWLYRIAENLGIQIAPAENAFSALSPAEQERQRKQAKGILPWER